MHPGNKPQDAFWSSSRCLPDVPYLYVPNGYFILLPKFDPQCIFSKTHPKGCFANTRNLPNTQNVMNKPAEVFRGPHGENITPTNPMISAKLIIDWDIRDVVHFVANSCAFNYQHEFYVHGINGDVLRLLNVYHLTTVMKMPLGVALKFKKQVQDILEKEKFVYESFEIYF